MTCMKKISKVRTINIKCNMIQTEMDISMKCINERTQLLLQFKQKDEKNKMKWNLIEIETIMVEECLMILMMKCLKLMAIKILKQEKLIKLSNNKWELNKRQRKRKPNNFYVVEMIWANRASNWVQLNKKRKRNKEIVNAEYL